ncbi:MAG: SsrA-binding protein SmpB [Candidatus Bipolaricaulota bacterium]|nr:MAG: SsrA-binding protein SmpB [Candidatus Bipolaricaulota bacterium]
MSVKVVATNRKARHKYEISDTIEAGLVLAGTEVKSLRQGGCALGDGYAVIRDGEATLKSVHIAAYKQGSIHNVDSDRDRRLLLHRREILRLATKTQEQGFTLVPLKIYFKNGVAKVELGVARGRKTYDKRRKLREDDERRRTDEALKRFSRGQAV